MEALQLEGWELRSYPDGPEYLEKIFNGHELRIVPKIVDDWPRTETADVNFYGLLDRVPFVGATVLAICAASLVDWTKAEGLKQGKAP